MSFFRYIIYLKKEFHMTKPIPKKLSPEKKLQIVIEVFKNGHGSILGNSIG